MTFPCKEELVLLEELAARQKRIYPDAADVGVLVDDLRPDQLEAPRAALKALMAFYGYVVTKWGDTDHTYGQLVSLFIPIEMDEGLWSGQVLTVTYNHTTVKRMDFITIDTFRERKSAAEAIHAYGCKVLKED